VPFIEYQERLYRLKEGNNVLGGDEAASIKLPQLSPGHRVTISVETVGSFAWTDSASDRIALNGRPLSREPVPLFHGDRLVLNGSTVLFIDDGGEPTVHLEGPSARAVPAAVASHRAGLEPTRQRGGLPDRTREAM